MSLAKSARQSIARPCSPPAARPPAASARRLPREDAIKARGRYEALSARDLHPSGASAAEFQQANSRWQAPWATWTTSSRGFRPNSSRLSWRPSRLRRTSRRCAHRQAGRPRRLQERLRLLCCVIQHPNNMCVCSETLPRRATLRSQAPAAAAAPWAGGSAHDPAAPWKGGSASDRQQQQQQQQPPPLAPPPAGGTPGALPPPAAPPPGGPPRPLPPPPVPPPVAAPPPGGPPGMLPPPAAPPPGALPPPLAPPPGGPPGAAAPPRPAAPPAAAAGPSLAAPPQPQKQPVLPPPPQLGGPPPPMAGMPPPGGFPPGPGGLPPPPQLGGPPPFMGGPPPPPHGMPLGVPTARPSQVPGGVPTAPPAVRPYGVPTAPAPGPQARASTRDAAGCGVGGRLHARKAGARAADSLLRRRRQTTSGAAATNRPPPRTADRPQRQEGGHRARGGGQALGGPHAPRVARERLPHLCGQPGQRGGRRALLAWTPAAACRWPPRVSISVGNGAAAVLWRRRRGCWCRAACCRAAAPLQRGTPAARPAARRPTWSRAASGLDPVRPPPPPPPPPEQVSDSSLASAFSRFPTFQKAKVGARAGGGPGTGAGRPAARAGDQSGCARLPLSGRCARLARAAWAACSSTTTTPPARSSSTRSCLDIRSVRPLPHPPLHLQPTSRPLARPPTRQVIKYAHNGKSKGFGFVSFGDAIEGARVIKEMQGKYVGACGSGAGVGGAAGRANAWVRAGCGVQQQGGGRGCVLAAACRARARLRGAGLPGQRPGVLPRHPHSLARARRLPTPPPPRPSLLPRRQPPGAAEEGGGGGAHGDGQEGAAAHARGARGAGRGGWHRPAVARLGCAPSQLPALAATDQTPPALHTALALPCAAPRPPDPTQPTHPPPNPAALHPPATQPRRTPPARHPTPPTRPADAQAEGAQAQEAAPGGGAAPRRLARAAVARQENACGGPHLAAGEPPCNPPPGTGSRRCSAHGLTGNGRDVAGIEAGASVRASRGHGPPWSGTRAARRARRTCGRHSSGVGGGKGMRHQGRGKQQC